jgi:hypothetical protein
MHHRRASCSPLLTSAAWLDVMNNIMNRKFRTPTRWTDNSPSCKAPHCSISNKLKPRHVQASTLVHSQTPTPGPSHQSDFERPAVRMLQSQHGVGVRHITGALLAQGLPVPFVTSGTVLFPHHFILTFDRWKEWDAVGQLIDRLAIHRDRSEWHRLLEIQNSFGRKRGRWTSNSGRNGGRRRRNRNLLSHPQLRQRTTLPGQN